MESLLLVTRGEDTCAGSNDYNGHNGLRILAVFIILISSGLGVFFPILSSTYSFIRLPNWCFFIAKFFGSGVIIATAFIHLLDPAAEALGNDCLGGTFVDYPWAFGICLMSLFLLFFTEIMTHYFIAKNMGHSHGHDDDHVHEEKDECDGELDETSMQNIQLENVITGEMNLHHNNSHNVNHGNMDMGVGIVHEHYDEYVDDSNKVDKLLKKGTNVDLEMAKSIISDTISVDSSKEYSNDNTPKSSNIQDSEIHDHKISRDSYNIQTEDQEQYMARIMAVFILEFGIIFHSVFVGLSLSVSGEEFETLFIVLTFHQMFEGLGLGTRVAETHWPDDKRYTPWLMGLAFTLTSPIAVAIGIGVRHSWVPGSRRALIANGIFDSISAGILIYTGLVELMAHEFLYSHQFKGEDGLKRMLFAYLIMCAGAALMALLGKWA